MAHPYASVVDMKAFYKTAPIDDLTGTDDAVLLETLNHSSREMDGYFQKFGYVVPLAPSTPGRAKDVCRVITLYWLWTSQPEGKDPPESIIENYKNAIKWLEDVASGEVDLGTEIEVETDSSGQDLAQTTLNLDDRNMTAGQTDTGRDRNSLAGFAIDDDESGDD